MPDSLPTLKLFNTLTGREEEFVPLDAEKARSENRPPKVKMYVCGPTVYDDAHLGHARCYITWDVLYRFLKFLGYDVTYVRNVTDVDDKILNRARERGESPSEVAEKNYQSFSEDMRALNVLPPDEEPRATQYIAQMIETIQGLIEKQAAYITPEGTVYFRVEAKADYGKLSKKPLDDLRAGARVEVDPHKESPLDFALWKHVPLEEQSQEGHAFDSPWGKGRPGWHIECSAMNYACLGPQIDIHAGGADLIFPHHENEIAQTEAWLGLSGDAEDKRFAKYWMHNGFVNVSGEKMSKSLGNFSTIKKLLEKYDPNTVRYFLLQHKYRMPVNFNDEAMIGPKNRIRLMNEWLQVIFWSLQDTCEEQGLTFNLEEELFKTINQYQESEYCTDKYLDDFIHILLDDLNAPRALAELGNAFGVMKAMQKPKALFLKVVTMLGILGFDINRMLNTCYVPIEKISEIHKELTGQEIESDQEVVVLLEEILQHRKKAKEIKDWLQADTIRKQLTDIGLQILDEKDGTTIVLQGRLELVRV